MPPPKKKRKQENHQEDVPTGFKHTDPLEFIKAADARAMEKEKMKK